MNEDQQDMANRISEEDGNILVMYDIVRDPGKLSIPLALLFRRPGDRGH